MSRTDVHRPWWVQYQDRDNQHRLGRVNHHHWERDCWDPQTRQWLVERLVPCDHREPDPARQPTPGGRRCQRDPLYGLCACTICSGRETRKLSRRQQRAALRAQLRDAVKTAPADRDTIDIPSPQRMTAWISLGRTGTAPAYTEEDAGA